MWEQIAKLPDATASWTCPYFLVIVAASAWLIALALISPATPDIFATLGALSLGVALGTRSVNPGESCRV